MPGLVVTGHDEAAREETVEVAHEALIRTWARLRRWLDADREFLLWRQRLRTDLAEWEHTERDEGTCYVERLWSKPSAGWPSGLMTLARPNGVLFRRAWPCGSGSRACETGGGGNLYGQSQGCSWSCYYLRSSPGNREIRLLTRPKELWPLRSWQKCTRTRLSSKRLLRLPRVSRGSSKLSE